MKKIRNLCIVVIGMMALMANSCEKDATPDFPIKFDLKLLDSTGQSINTFKEGDTITLSFEISNSTNEVMDLSNFQPDFLCSYNTNFFIIYQKSGSGNTWIDLGKACNNVMACTLEGGFILSALETRKIQYRWPSIYENCTTGNGKLTKGNYKTSLNYTFRMNGGKYDNQEKTINTTVYFNIQ